jgi:uncharacterized protein YndB with AHSA1/START domain
MATVYQSSIIEAPISAVWDYIRDFNSLPKWFPGVSDSHIEGTRAGDHPGCIRNFGLPGGSRMREELLEFSDQHHFCAYRMLDGAVPMSRYQARVRLMPVTDGDRTFAELTADFDCAAGQEGEVAAFLGDLYQGAFDMLKKHFSKGLTAGR